MTGCATSDDKQRRTELVCYQPLSREAILDGVPNFTMHIVRSTTAGYILELAGLLRGMASLMIAHELPGHHMSDLDRVGDTGKRYYGPMLCWMRSTSIMDYLPLLS